MIATIEYKGVELDVEYDVDPFEEQTRDHAGQAMNVIITDITFQGVDFNDLLEDSIDDIELLLYEYEVDNHEG